MRYIIYGAGAIGSILGGHLQRAGARVVLVGTARHVLAIRRRGLTVRTADTMLRVRPRAVARAANLAPFAPGDVVLLCAKTQQTVKCLSQLRVAGAPRDLPVFCCQNSFLNEPLTTLFFNRVYGVAVLVDGIFVQPGEVLHPTGRRFGHLEIGRYPGGLDRLSRRVARDLRAAGFAIRLTPDVMRAKRAKFVLNMANAVIAITNQPEQAAPLVRRLRAEAVRVLRATGLTFDSLADFRSRGAASCGPLLLPPGVASSGLVPDSTWQSLYRRTGRVETPFFNGLVVFLGQSLGIPTPCNALICRVAESMARRGERPGKYTVKALSRMLVSPKR